MLSWVRKGAGHHPTLLKSFYILPSSISLINIDFQEFESFVYLLTVQLSAVPYVPFPLRYHLII
jgi:hypothetical protein